jgi:hypothetical protein
MRIWDLNPGFLNDQSLLGEHRELHGIFSILVNHKKGYARHPETRRWRGHLPALALRHALLVAEMELRGFHHHSPLSPTPRGRLLWPAVFVDCPARQFEILRTKYQGRSGGRIPLPGNPQQLWASHKYSVMARNPAECRRLGPLVARQGVSMEDLAGVLVALLRLAPGPGRMRNAVQHLYGYISDRTDLDSEQADFTSLLREIGRLARELKIKYLLESTALSELLGWDEYLHRCPD